MAIDPQRVDDYLRDRWKDLRNACAADHLAAFREAVEALRALGLLTNDQAELWQRRKYGCPGHDDEGGRAWCAYCGELAREPEEPTT